MAENRNAQQVREITDKLEQGLKELFESERFKEYLKTMSKFYNYSFNNTILIAMQKPDATLIAGYTAWQRNFDRHVMLCRVFSAPGCRLWQSPICRI